MQYFHISDKELMKVTEFRNFVIQNGNCVRNGLLIGYYLNLPDETLYRYLVTSNYKMAPACNYFTLLLISLVSKIIKMIEWRVQNRIDSLLNDVYAMKVWVVFHIYDSLLLYYRGKFAFVNMVMINFKEYLLLCVSM